MTGVHQRMQRRTRASVVEVVDRTRVPAEPYRYPIEIHDA